MPDQFPLIYRLAVGIYRRIYFPTHGGLTAIGRERVPDEGGLILAPVHMSHLDPPAVADAVSNRRCRALAKEELFKIPVFGPIIAGIGAFPVRRGEGDTEAIRKCIAYLKAGETVIVFPEGTRNDGETMLPLAQGTAMLAKKAGVPVVPIGIAGTQKLMPHGKDKPKVKKYPVRVVIGEPFRYEDVMQGSNEKERRAAFLEELQNRLVALTAEAGIQLKKPSSKSDPGEYSSPETAAEAPDPA